MYMEVSFVWVFVENNEMFVCLEIMMFYLLRLLAAFLATFLDAKCLFAW